MTDAFVSRTVAQRIGGRWALSWQSCLITGSVAMLVYFVEGVSATKSPDVGRWIVLVALAAGASSVSVLAMHLTAFSNRDQRPIRPWLVIGADGAFGAIFNAVVWLGASAWSLPTGSASVRSLGLAIVFAMWWGAMFTIFLDYREESRVTRTALIEQALRVELARIQQDEIVNRLKEEIAAEVDEELRPALVALNRLIGDVDVRIGAPLVEGEDWPEVAGLLRRTAEGSLRPISKRLWRKVEAQYPRTPWWTLPANVVRYQPFRPLLLVMIHVLATASLQFRQFGAPRAVALLMLEVTAIVAITVPINALMSRYPALHVRLFVLGIIALQAPLPLRAHIRNEWAPGTASVGWMLTQAVVGVVIILVTSGVGAWTEESGQMRANFRQAIDQDQVRSIARSKLVAQLARATARTLHGSVQTRLVTCAMAIDRANATGDSAMLTAALGEAMDALNSPLIDEGAGQPLSAEIERKMAMWQGLCEISLEVNLAGLETAVSDSSVAAIALIVEEGLSNAIRHGDATRVSIRADVDRAQGMIIVIDDDGRGPAMGEPGVGSALIEQATFGRWSLTPLARGSRLEALVLL